MEIERGKKASKMKIFIKNKSELMLCSYKDLFILLFRAILCVCVNLISEMGIQQSDNEQKLKLLFESSNIHLLTDALLCLINKYGVDKAYIRKFILNVKRNMRQHQ